MIVKFASALLDGLSAPQALAAKLLGGGFLAAGIYFGYNWWAAVKFQSGFDSRNEYVAEIEDKYTVAESERRRLDVLLTECNRLKNTAQSKASSLTTQLAELTEKSASMLLETQKINAQALAAASRNSNKDAGFYNALTTKLEGLTNECDANGNSTVPGGADILRAIQQKK